jgi:hypothetical protein
LWLRLEMKITFSRGNAGRHLLFQLGLWLGLIGMAHAAGELPHVDSVEIVQKGIYESDLLARLPSPPGDVGGAVLSAKPRLVSKDGDTTATARIGLLFGLRFKPVGGPLGEVAQLRITVIYPPPGLPNPTTQQPQPSVSRDVRRTIGDIHFLGLTLDSESDLVPGPWILQISQDGKVLAEQRFDLVKATR